MDLNIRNCTNCLRCTLSENCASVKITTYVSQNMPIEIVIAYCTLVLTCRYTYIILQRSKTLSNQKTALLPKPGEQLAVQPEQTTSPGRLGSQQPTHATMASQTSGKPQQPEQHQAPAPRQSQLSLPRWPAAKRPAWASPACPGGQRPA